MTKYELFTMIFYVLDYYWDQYQEEELGDFLRDMSPFTFADIGSADPAVYSEFCDFIMFWMKDFISLTDLARYQNSSDPSFTVKNWLRRVTTIDYIGL